LAADGASGVQEATPVAGETTVVVHTTSIQLLPEEAVWFVQDDT
jgi:hypothetical protein